jgi:WD40 repeat protein
VTVYRGPHGQAQIATASSDGSVRLWDPKQRAQIGERLQASRKPIMAVTSFLKGGERESLLVTAGYHGDIQIWDPGTGRQKQPPLHGGQRAVLALAAFTGAGKRALLASAGTDRMVRIWDLKAHTTFGEPMEGHRRCIRAITTLKSPLGTWLATGSDDKTIRIWNPRERIQVGDPIRLPSRVLSLTSFTQDSCSLLAAGTADGRIRIIDPENHCQEVPALAGHKCGVGAITSFQSNKDGRVLIASGSWNGELRIWEPRERELQAVIPVGFAITGICATEGRMVVAGNEGLIIINLP